MIGGRRLSASRLFLLAFFVVMGAVVLFPFYFLLVSSFRPSQELFTSGFHLGIRLKGVTLTNYQMLLQGSGVIYLSWYKNSILITGLFTAFSLFLSSLVGYGLGVYVFKGRNLIFTLVLFLLMIPLEILMLPLYKLLVTIHLINTYAGVILPFVVSPAGVFFFRQYSSGVPRDYVDAGRMDGCTEYGIYARIMAPLMRPAFGAMAILLAMREWNDFLWPLIVLRTNENFTIPVGLASLMSPYGNNYDMLIAGAILAIVPIVILFLFNQRAFVSGLTVGGIKG
ncbi:MAG TPA: carbohydrate ABC transporter permease [Spirochaetia bacterium]|nr:carbohydrate ABC transporter permease [Spirochaetia bacterium]